MQIRNRLVYSFLAAGSAVAAAALIMIWASAEGRTRHYERSQVGEILPTDQSTNIPYFTVRDGMNSVLTLNNIAPSTTVAKVTLFRGEGRPQELPTTSVGPHAFTQINLADVIESPDFDSGNIRVAFSGAEMILTAQVSVTDASKRLSFESREQDMMDFMSSDLNGILWVPQSGAAAFLAITSVATSTLSVDLTLGSDVRHFVLGSRETRLVKLGDEFGQQPPAPALVRLHHNGIPGDIIASGFVLNLDKGYSSSLPLVDSSIASSTHLAGTGLRLGPADPAQGFPSGATFRSPLLLANVGDHPVKAHISLDYSADGKSENVSLKVVNIPPGAVRRVELSEELAKSGITGPVAEAGVDVTYDADPDAIIGQLTSFDQTGDYSKSRLRTPVQPMK